MPSRRAPSARSQGSLPPLLTLNLGSSPILCLHPGGSGSGGKRPVDDRKLLGVGLVGAAVAALCCFTPVLVVLLTTVGLSALVGWLDYVLLPALAIFVALAVYGLIRQRRANSQGGGLRNHG